jgi:lysophospholipid acyltransferase (LPLAT)-like uncharacterized protein
MIRGSHERDAEVAAAEQASALEGGMLIRMTSCPATPKTDDGHAHERSVILAKRNAK